MVDFESNRVVEDSFVIDASINGVLFSFCHSSTQDGSVAGHMYNHNTQDFVFQTDKGRQSLYINDLTFDNEKKVLTVNLSDENSGADDKQLGDNLSYVRADHSFNYIDISSAVGITVAFCYGDRQKRVKFFLAPSAQIIDAVVDSGSEATQIAVFKRGENFSVNNLMPIVNDTLTHFNINNNEFSAEDFIQAEVDGDVHNPRLFKTRFFVKNKLGIDELRQCSLLPNREDSPILRMLATPDELEDMRRDYIQLYNMKIASFGGVELPMINVEGLDMPITQVGNANFYYRKYMNVFLHEILTRIFKKREMDAIFGLNNDRKLLSLYVLMPNVYTPQKTQEYLDHIREDLEKIIDADDNFKDTILGFSVTTVSESDASLVGAISMSLGYNAGTYLIMDAGKGTLDFSVVEVNERGKLENKMKSGIIGASAAISYGFVLDLLLAYLDCRNIKADNLQSFIYENILGKSRAGRAAGGGDLCHLNNLMNAVDTYKIKYDSMEDTGKLEKLNDAAADDSFSLEAFAEWVKKLPVKVAIPNVCAIIDKITSYSIAKMATSLKEEQSVDYVVFAGRGFLFNELKSNMLDALKQRYDGIVEKSFIKPDNATNNKNVCMFITNDINDGRYNNQLLPEPRALDESVIRTVEEIKNAPTEAEETNRSSRLRRYWNLLWDGGRMQDRNNYRKTIAGGYNDDPFALGYTKECRPNQYYAIGGAFYRLPSYITPGNADIFNSNGKIFIRYNHGIVEELTEVPSLAVGLAVPSLFPYCNLTSSRDVYIPVIRTAASETGETRSDRNTEENTEVHTGETQPDQGETAADTHNPDTLLDKIRVQTGGVKH